MSAQNDREKREETERLAMYRMHVINWLLSDSPEELDRASVIAKAHDRVCACKECGLDGLAARHETFVKNLGHKHVKSWHRLLSWFGSEGMTGFYQRVHVVFGTMLLEAFPRFYKDEYPRILSKSPFGTNYRQAYLSAVGNTITIECSDRNSLSAFLKKLGLSDPQVDALTASGMSDSVVHDIILGDHGWSVDAETGKELCLI